MYNETVSVRGGVKMTYDSRVDRLEGMMERIVVENAEMRQDMRDMRSTMQTMHDNIQARIGRLQSDIDAKFRTLSLLMIGLWGTTVAAIIGVFLTLVLGAD